MHTHGMIVHINVKCQLQGSYLQSATFLLVVRWLPLTFFMQLTHKVKIQLITIVYMVHITSIQVFILQLTCNYNRTNYEFLTKHLKKFPIFPWNICTLIILDTQLQGNEIFMNKIFKVKDVPNGYQTPQGKIKFNFIQT